MGKKGADATADRERLRIVVRICKLYFEEGKTQQAIAELLSLSRTQVVRYIGMGRKLGIVQTRVLDPFATRKDLEENIKARFGLKAVRVATNSYADDPLLPHSLARLGCDFLRQAIGSASVVGMGWGKSLSALVEHFPAGAESYPGATWVPLIGGIGESDMIFQPNDFVQAMKRKAGGLCRPLYAPALVDSREMRDIVLSMESMKAVVKGWEDLEIALVGIGALIPAEGAKSPSVHARYFPHAEREAIYSSHAVGDILSQYFDEDGDLCDLAVNSRIIGVDIARLRDVPLSIGVAGGRSKFEAVLGALRGRYINALITDETMAQALVDGAPGGAGRP